MGRAVREGELSGRRGLGCPPSGQPAVRGSGSLTTLSTLGDGQQDQAEEERECTQRSPDRRWPSPLGPSVASPEPGRPLIASGEEHHHHRDSQPQRHGLEPFVVEGRISTRPGPVGQRLSSPRVRRDDHPPGPHRLGSMPLIAIWARWRVVLVRSRGRVARPAPGRGRRRVRVVLPGTDRPVRSQHRHRHGRQASIRSRSSPAAPATMKSLRGATSLPMSNSNTFAAASRSLVRTRRNVR